MRLALPYHEIGTGNILGIAMRLFIIISGLISVFILMNIVDNKKNILTKLGINSLAIYVLHPYITRLEIAILKKFDFGFVFNDMILSILFITISTIIIVFVLSRDVVTNSTNKMIDIVTKAIMR